MPEFHTDVSAEDVPAAERPAYWRHIMRGQPVPLEGRTAAGAAFRARVRTADAGAVRIAEHTTPPGECARTPRLARAADPGLYQLEVIDRGSVLMEHAGRENRLGPGDLAFTDPAMPVRYRHTATRHVTVLFPRAMLPLCPGGAQRLAGLRVPGDRGTGALVSELVRRLPGRLDDCSAAEAARLGGALVDLVAVALAAGLDRDAPPDEIRQRSLLTLIYAHIDAHLGDPGLSPATVAAAHHISVRRLHQLFAGQDATAAGWIRRRRLERCRRDLRDPALRERPVAALGARYGFTDPNQFNRAFRREYGLTPGAYRAGEGP